MGGEQTIQRLESSEMPILGDDDSKFELLIGNKRNIS